MKKWMHALERVLELGGIKKDIVLLALSGAAVIGSLLGVPAVRCGCGMGGDHPVRRPDRTGGCDWAGDGL